MMLLRLCEPETPCLHSQRQPRGGRSKRRLLGGSEMPETRIPGKMYPSGHANEGVHAIMMLLEDWFLAMEDGTAVFRQPDPNYQRSGGRPTWTEEELDRLMRDLDAEIDQEVG